MYVAPATKAMILEELQRPGADIQRISRQYGIPNRIIRELQGGDNEPSTFQEEFGGFGRPELQPFIVSRVKAGNAWPLSDVAAIDKARRDYDAGFVEVCQGRDGNWIILYAIPRQRPEANRTAYFSRELEA